MLRTCCAVLGGLLASATLAAPVQRNSDDAGTIYLGAIADRDWGRPMASGDLDGDGYDEAIVAASDWDYYNPVISRVYVIRGGPDAHRRGVMDLSSNGVDQVIVGAQANDHLGTSVATGDVNTDGIDDLLVCASEGDYGTRTDAGIAYLIYGGPGFFASPTRDLSVTGSWDLRIAGPVVYGDLGGAGSFGGMDTHAAAIGNLNGDAFGDIVLGVHLANGSATQSGRVYVVFGKEFAAGATLDLNESSAFDVRIYGEGEYDETGDYVLTGDLTGDGIDELIIPNHYYSQYLFDSEGAVHVYRGRLTWTKLLYLSTPPDIRLLGDRKYDELGDAAAVGDFNRDGIMDLAAGAPGVDVGAWNLDRGEGFVYGLLGSTAYQTGTHTIDYTTATPDFRVVGEYQENLGTTVSAGDFNGDGYDDVAASEWFAGPATNGVVEILFGRAFAGHPTFTANVDTDVHFVGAPDDRIGFSLSAGDSDGNGVDEVFFGTPFNNGPIGAEKGTAYVFSLVDGDSDGDGDVDLRDFAAFQECFTGGGGERSGSTPCYVFDFEPDEAIDLGDFPDFVERLTGP